MAMLVGRNVNVDIGIRLTRYVGDANVIYCVIQMSSTVTQVSSAELRMSCLESMLDAEQVLKAVSVVVWVHLVQRAQQLLL